MTDQVNLLQSRALRAVRRRATITHPAWVGMRWLLRGLTVFALLGVVVGLLSATAISTLVVGGLLIVSALLLGALVVDFYCMHAWSALPVLPPLAQTLKDESKLNLADYLTVPAAELIMAIPASQQAAATWPLVVLVSAAQQTLAQWMLQRLALVLSAEDLAALRDAETDAQEPTPNLIVAHAAEEALSAGRDRIDDVDLILAAFKLDPHGSQLLSGLGLTIDDVRLVGAWLTRLRAAQIHRPIWQEAPGAGIAQDWTSGYTPFLRNFVQDLTEVVRGAGGLRIVGRDAEIAQLEQTLAKNRGHNVLLVGQPGIGKETLILGLAEQFARGRVGQGLAYQHLLQLDIGAVLAGVSDRGEIESRLLQIFSEASRAGNAILVIPDVHLLVGGGERVAGVDATELLVQILQSPAIRVIATTTPGELQSRIASQSSLIGLFERLDVAEPAPEAVVEILQNAVLAHEVETQGFFTFAALKEISTIARRYAKDQPAPENALNLLAEMASHVSASGERLVTPEVVRQVLSTKLQVPLDVAGGGERDKLVSLETDLRQTVVAQDEAISALASALRRARSGLSSGKRPIASMLFLGPTGVGKTETAKALARVYFGGEDRMIRFDMSEYSQPDSLVRLIGAPGANGTKVGGLLADAVHDRPFSLVLLDEFEKAHPQILNLFLQILDDGRLTDGTGRVVDFTNTIIIATSNAGAELIRQSIAAGEDQETRRKHLLDALQTQGIYKPELLNRFDGVVAFQPLAAEHVRAIVELMLGQLAAKLLAEQQMTITFAPDLVDALATGGFDPQFGARPVRRLIQDKVETFLANAILAGTVQKGSTLTVSRADVGL